MSKADDYIKEVVEELVKLHKTDPSAGDTALCSFVGSLMDGYVSETNRPLTTEIGLLELIKMTALSIHTRKE